MNKYPALDPALREARNSVFPLEQAAIGDIERNQQNKDGKRINQRGHRPFVVDDDEPDNRRNAYIDEITQREMKSRFEVFRDQRDELEIQKPDDDSLDHLVTIAARRVFQQNQGQYPGFLEQETQQDDDQYAQHERKQPFHVPCQPPGPDLFHKFPHEFVNRPEWMRKPISAMCRADDTNGLPDSPARPFGARVGKGQLRGLCPGLTASWRTHGKKDAASLKASAAKIQRTLAEISPEKNDDHAKNPCIPQNSMIFPSIPVYAGSVAFDGRMRNAAKGAYCGKEIAKRRFFYDE
jgi:hypothetical protein